MGEPLPAFEILFEVEVKKPFALKEVNFYPCRRVFIIKCFVVSHFLLHLHF